MNIDFRSLSVDPELPPGYEDWVLTQVSLFTLRLIVRRGPRESMQYQLVPIQLTPHYFYVTTDDSTKYEQYMNTYGEEVGYGTEHSLEKFKAMRESFRYLRPPYERNYIIVEARFIDEAPHYIVLDGFHRLTILATRGETMIPVIVKNIVHGRRLRKTIFLVSFKEHPASQHEAFLQCAEKLS